MVDDPDMVKVPRIF